MTLHEAVLIGMIAVIVTLVVGFVLWAFHQLHRANRGDFD